MVRYRSRDITRLNHEPCACGRSHVRIMRVTGRDDDMMIIRGVNVYPSQVEAVLVGIAGVAPHYQIVLTRDGALDAMTVEVETAPDAPAGEPHRESDRQGDRRPDQGAARRELRGRHQGNRRSAALAGQGRARQGYAKEMIAAARFLSGRVRVDDARPEPAAPAAGRPFDDLALPVSLPCSKASMTAS